MQLYGKGRYRKKKDKNLKSYKETETEKRRVKKNQKGE